jgi:gas vesicle protein
MVVNALSGACNREGMTYSNDLIRRELNKIKSKAKRAKKPLNSLTKSQLTSECSNWLSKTNDPIMIKEINDLTDQISKM